LLLGWRGRWDDSAPCLRAVFLSNGQDVCFRVLFKPVATISMKQETLDIDNNEIELEARGRHDPCVLPRAVPIVEAMAAMTVLDLFLTRNQ